MRLNRYLVEANDITEGTGLGADGLSKQKLKTMLYKATKNCTYNKIYKDASWQGVKCIWDTFDKLNINWQMTKAEYKHDKDAKFNMPTSKEWHFEINWDNNKGKHQKLGGYVIAAGAGSVDDPLDKYDVTMILF